MKKERQLLPGYRLHGKRLLPQFRFLVFLLAYPRNEFTVKEFQRDSGLKNKMTVYRYLAQAEQLHLIERVDGAGVRSNFYARKKTSVRYWRNKHRSGYAADGGIGGSIHHQRLYRKTFKLVLIESQSGR